MKHRENIEKFKTVKHLEEAIQLLKEHIKIKEAILEAGRPGTAFIHVVRDLNAMKWKLKAKLDTLERVKTGRGSDIVMDQLNLPTGSWT